MAKETFNTLKTFEEVFSENSVKFSDCRAFSLFKTVPGCRAYSHFKSNEPSWIPTDVYNNISISYWAFRSALKISKRASNL